ncbi:enoyl-CoA hydratase/isomerase family protein, partial [candidate division KSB1 bacterium]|nr:enoyl-CoA hydratase/isomerase family protein [candidate division KSB1 bacterium]
MKAGYHEKEIAMENYTNILVEIKNKIAYLTLNRPDKLNALNWKTMQELQHALAAVKDDATVGGVILTGAGEKAFAAGADIGELAQQTPVSAKEFSLQSQEILRFVEHFPKPIIAAVNGFCLGGGSELALACHMRVASEKATPRTTHAIIQAVIEIKPETINLKSNGKFKAFIKLPLPY